MKNYYFKNRSSLMLINYQCGLLIKYEEDKNYSRIFECDNNIQSFNGLLNGKIINYYPNGNKFQTINYYNSLKHGKEISQLQSGEIFEERIYQYRKRIFKQKSLILALISILPIVLCYTGIVLIFLISRNLYKPQNNTDYKSLIDKYLQNNAYDYMLLSHKIQQIIEHALSINQTMMCVNDKY